MEEFCRAPYPVQYYDKTTTMTDPKMSFMTRMPAGGNPAVPGGTGGYNCWLWLLYPYHKAPGVYACPSAKNRNGWTYAMSGGFTVKIDEFGNIVVNGYNMTPDLLQRGTEPYRNNKILAIDGCAGIKTLSPIGMQPSPYTFWYINYHDWPHLNGCNVLFIDGSIKWMPGGAPPLCATGPYYWNHPFTGSGAWP